MAVPDFQSLMLPLLKLAGDGQPHTLAEAVEQLAQEFQLSDDDRTQLLRSGQTRLYNRVGWTTTYLKKAGLLRAVGPGRYQLTERGREVLASGPATIDVAFLESRFPEMSEFRKPRSRGDVAGEEPPATFNNADGTWNQRAGVEERVRETLEQSIPSARSRFRWPQASPAHRARNACTFARALSPLPSRASSTVPAPADRCYPRLSARFYCAIRAPSTSVPHLGYTGTYAQVRSREGRKVVYTPTERR